VYKVKHRESKKEYAAKYLKDFMKHDAIARMMVREITILRKLSKEKNNIFTTRLNDIILAGDKDSFESVFLIMELQSGDLRQLMNTKDLAFEDEHALIVLYNLLCALNYIHSAGIMHRDVKPGNILINSSCQVKICDFGMARSFYLEEQEKLGSDDLQKAETIADLEKLKTKVNPKNLVKINS
jgi:serine/threonine protein kinase